MEDLGPYPNDAWASQAACRGQGVEVFFPLNATEMAAAQRVCADCPVSRACLEHAVKYPDLHGVWGGTSERERDRIRQVRRYRNRTDRRSA